MREIVFKNSRKIFLAIAVLFFLTTVLSGAHAHSKPHEEKVHACSLCQASHLKGKSFLVLNQKIPFELIPVSATPPAKFFFLFSDPQQLLTIRGPPLA